MDFTNINDPAGVAALLDQLRASQAWTDLQSSRSQDSDSEQQNVVSAPPAPVITSITDNTIPAPSGSEQQNTSGPSVASLLSALQTPSTSTSASQSHVATPPIAIVNGSGPTTNMPKPILKRTNTDPRFFTFQRSLPYLASLSEDPEFLGQLTKLKEEQEKLERDLWQERLNITSSQAERVKVAITKANLVGEGITEQDANTLKAKFQAELDYFDRRRVHAAWEGLITKQQTALAKLGVPTMFVSGSANDRERQKRVVQVLEGITKSDELE